MSQPSIARLFSLLLLVALAGCGPLSPKADPTRYYVLKAKSTGSLTSGPKLAVGVGPATIPGYLDRDEIVTAGPASGLKVAEFNVWGEALDKAVIHVVARNMSQLLNSPAVVPFPDADAKVDYKTEIVIRRFEMGPDNKVHLEASYFVERSPRSDEKGTSRSRRIVVGVSQPESHDAIVDAMSVALAELSKSIARDVLTVSRQS